MQNVNFNTNGFVVVENYEQYAVLTNTSGNYFNFSCGLQETIYYSFPIYFLVIMNGSLEGYLVINQGADLLQTRPYLEQSCQGFLGFTTVNGQGYNYGPITCNYGYATGPIVPANSIKIIATIYPYTFKCWPYKGQLKGFYCTDIGLDWIQVVNVTKVTTIDPIITTVTTYSEKA